MKRVIALLAIVAVLALTPTAYANPVPPGAGSGSLVVNGDIHLDTMHPMTPKDGESTAIPVIVGTVPALVFPTATYYAYAIQGGGYYYAHKDLSGDFDYAFVFQPLTWYHDDEAGATIYVYNWAFYQWVGNGWIIWDWGEATVTDPD